ncbi:MAG TPA: hypothetical protein VMF09_04810 [Solirubrobacteraceae bacterium]|nr:hypothetical protein [Solirubrobacteraceae bacterium]
MEDFREARLIQPLVNRNFFACSESEWAQTRVFVSFQPSFDREVAVRVKVRVSLVALAVSALMAVPAAAAQASLGIASFVGINCKPAAETCGEQSSETTDVFGSTLYETKEPDHKASEEQGYTQAGGHVPWGVTDFTVAHAGSFKEDNAVPTAAVTHVRVDVAPGLATSPANVPQCTRKEFGETEVPVPGFGFYEAPKCKAGGLGPHETGPESTVIGEESATVFAGAAGDVVLSGVLYNLEQPKPPERARASLYGAALKLPIGLTKGILEARGITGAPAAKQYYSHTLVEGNVEWGREAKGTGAGDYHDYFEVNVSPFLPLVRSRQVDYGRAGNGAFITNATNCPGNHTTTLTLESIPLGSEAEMQKSLESGVREVSRTPYETLIGLQECNKDPFKPIFSLTPEASGHDEPDQITTEFSLPQFSGEEEIDSSQVKTASITLPEGMTLNPSAAAGLEACTVAQARIHSETFGVACPVGSELGTVSLEVPTLPAGSLTGAVYLGGPVTGSETAPITGPPYIIYVVANSTRYDVSVRLKGEVIPNEATGQLTAVFDENPEQPFTKLTLHFNRGVLTSVANPLVCGTPSGSSNFTPVATEGVPAAAATFGVSITGCGEPLPFSLRQSTEGDTQTAGAHTSYDFSLTRSDGEQYLEKVKTTLPEGLVGAIPDVTQCGEPQAANDECAAASRIGTATVTAGAGNFPFSFSGPVYLTGPYDGAPYGLLIPIEAVAGPFDLGKVVTRATININPTTTRVTTEATLPTIVKGVPIRLRSLNVNITKQGYLYNPTHCSGLETESTLTSTFGTVQSGLKSPLTVEGCSGLAFKPTFTASTSGKYAKAGTEAQVKLNGASLVTTITQAPGQANIKSVLVQLPKQLPSRLTTLQKACLAKTFEENPLSCKTVSPESVVGTVRAVTPVLPNVMEGPAILVSHAGEEFPSLELVLEADNVRVVVEGKTHIKNKITTTFFESSPDVPVSSITVNLPLGKNSALAPERLTTNLCTAKLIMPTTITGQNGKVVKQNTVIKPAECPVQIVGRKVVGNTVYLTVRTYSAGRISGSGSGLSTTRRKLASASGAATLKVPLSRSGRRRRRPFKVKVRVGFTPKQKGAKSSSTSVTVRFG